MWVPSTWETEEDVEKDLLLMAEYSIHLPKTQKEETKVPDTILQYRRQMAENKQKPLHSDIDDNASYVVSGRGRGIRDRVIRPGGTVDYHPLDDAELKKQIRQASGFGYSNEFIEQSIKAKVYDPDKDTDTSDFRLVSSSSSTSGRSSVESSPIKRAGRDSPGRSKFKIEEFPPLQRE